MIRLLWFSCWCIHLNLIIHMSNYIPSHCIISNEMHIFLSLSWAVNVPVVFAEPSQMGVAPCSARSYWMRRGWACTSVSCATWPMRFCRARRTADGTSIRTDSAHLPCSWPSLPLYRYISLSSAWLFALYIALWLHQISTFGSLFFNTPVTGAKRSC